MAAVEDWEGRDLLEQGQGKGYGHDRDIDLPRALIRSNSNCRLLVRDAISTVRVTRPGHALD